MCCWQCSWFDEKTDFESGWISHEREQEPQTCILGRGMLHLKHKKECFYKHSVHTCFLLKICLKFINYIKWQKCYTQCAMPNIVNIHKALIWTLIGDIWPKPVFLLPQVTNKSYGCLTSYSHWWDIPLPQTKAQAVCITGSGSILSELLAHSFGPYKHTVDVEGWCPKLENMKEQRVPRYTIWVVWFFHLQVP